MYQMLSCCLVQVAASYVHVAEKVFLVVLFVCRNSKLVDTQSGKSQKLLHKGYGPIMYRKFPIYHIVQLTNHLPVNRY